MIVDEKMFTMVGKIVHIFPSSGLRYFKNNILASRLHGKKLVNTFNERLAGFFFFAFYYNQKLDMMRYFKNHRKKKQFTFASFLFILKVKKFCRVFFSMAEQFFH